MKPMVRRSRSRNERGSAAVGQLLTGQEWLAGLVVSPGRKWNDALTKIGPRNSHDVRTNNEPSVWDANRLRIATDAAGVALWSWNVDTDEIALDERA